jgi:hypothetical protein
MLTGPGGAQSMVQAVFFEYLGRPLVFDFISIQIRLVVEERDACFLG